MSFVEKLRVTHKMRRILDRKGEITTDNVLSLIVAVIGLGILIFGFVKLIGIYASNEDKNAQGFLDSVLEKAELLKNGESNDFVFQGFKGAGNWYLVGWSDEEDVNKKPEKCYFGSCVCICKSEEGTINREVLISSCQEGGFCKSVDKDDVSVKTRELFDQVLHEGSSRIECGVVRLQENLNELNVGRTEEGLSIIKKRELEATIGVSGDFVAGRDSFCYNVYGEDLYDY